MIVCLPVRNRIHLQLGALLAAVAVLLAAGCRQAPPSPHISLDGTLEELRTHFNADAGRTRVLMIVAPT